MRRGLRVLRHGCGGDRAHVREQPAETGLPAFRARCLSAYAVGHSAGHTDHYFFHFGLFGVGDRIKNADVLIVGSSHAIFGLSAERIAAALSERWGRPVTVFNMALGFGEGIGFSRDSPEQHGAG